MVKIGDTDGLFNYDYHRFVLQDLTLPQAPSVWLEHPKKFELNTKKSSKTKKDKDKDKDNKEEKPKPFT